MRALCCGGNERGEEAEGRGYWLGTTGTAGGVGTKGVAIYALANFCLACADHGKQLISLLPV